MTATKPTQTIRDILRPAAEALNGHSQSARLDAELLLAIACGKDRAWLYSHPDEPVTANQRLVFQTLLNQRATGRPLAQLTGLREFWSLELAVSEHTLIPRPETELLVEQALHKLPTNKPLQVLDLGTGSGAVAIALACERPAALLTATDCSAAALATAKANARQHCPGKISFYMGDWYSALPTADKQYAVIVSNPPYVGEQETEFTDRELAFEPVEALYSGKDGLQAIRQIIGGADPYLQSGGWLLLEHGFRQAPAVQSLLAKAGFVAVDNVCDLSGQPRVSYGQLR